ncbi:FG-GAP repeat domain-containing protein [Chitinophaga sp. RAB17]|uniref:FG-GAP repeat domain-containing protein n=1 Tax=Chitinophaga sp. RAB17 TaxID=3233049 RepID=UPI003F8F0C5D
MKKRLIPALAGLLFVTTAHAQQHVSKVTPSLKFEKQTIAAESYESVAVFDVNNDKIPDLVSGAFWYEGPAYFKRHYIGPVKQYGEYWDDFSTIPFDVNGDGRMDYITGGWFGKTLVWKENPGNDNEWKEHIIATPGNIETTRSWDIDGDGVPEIIPNTPNDPLIIFHHNKATGEFTAHKILDRKSGHGLGFGDVNGDGRVDIIIPEGWVEAPAAPFTAPWTFHPEFNLGTASVPVIVTDVNKDGLTDLIAGQGHDYGLDWHEQKKDVKTNKRTWIKHVIDPYNSQYHTMAWADIDGDGAEELVTGKRYRAHNDHDPGSDDPCGIYYFKWNGESFTKQVISYGSKGAGLYFGIYDLTGSGKKDIIVAGKDGLFIFYNKGNK